MKCVAPNDVKKTEPAPIEWMQLEGYKRYFTSTFWKENYLLAGYILLFIIAQLVMIIVRICQYKDFKNQDGSSPNVYYIVARATGIFYMICNEFQILLTNNGMIKSSLTFCCWFSRFLFRCRQYLSCAAGFTMGNNQTKMFRIGFIHPIG